MYADGIWFKDEQRRTRILRGVNLGGNSKLPATPNGATHLDAGFFDHRNVSFVGRPFPLDEADEHFARLKHWGMMTVRFIVTWEAVEHGGAGIYDEDYLAYLHAVIKKAADYGIQVFIDPHQDVWSRWTGGDGAPGWTLEAVGIDLTKLYVTGAAINHQQHGNPYPRMIWPTNFYKFGAATMFTLFFAGDDFAPLTTIDGVNTREYLQTHYINAMRRVAETLSDLPNVIGFDTMNEPLRGYIELSDLSSDEPHGLLAVGPTPTALESMALAAGYTVEVKDYVLQIWGNRMVGTVILNPDGERLWVAGADDIWQKNGVWDDPDGTPRVLRPYHFSQRNGQPVNFVEDYLKPFFRRYIRAIRSVKRNHMIFLEGVPNVVHPTWSSDEPRNVAYAGHWYDNATLFLKFFNRQVNADIQHKNIRFVFGRGSVQGMFTRQLAERKHAARDAMGGIPTLIGEFGVPFDMNKQSSFRTGDFSQQTNALDMYYNSMDENLLSCMLWNYAADNTNLHGDGWNGEDLSVFSRDQQTDPDDLNSGGRALDAVVRPYAIAIAGEPQTMMFNRERREFVLIWKPDESVTAPTEIFVPRLHYPKSYSVEGNAGLIFEADTKNQRLYITLGADFNDTTASIMIMPDND